MVFDEFYVFNVHDFDDRVVGKGVAMKVYCIILYIIALIRVYTCA